MAKLKKSWTKIIKTQKATKLKKNKELKNSNCGKVQKLKLWQSSNIDKT